MDDSETGIDPSVGEDLSPETPGTDIRATTGKDPFKNLIGAPLQRGLDRRLDP